MGNPNSARLPGFSGLDQALVAALFVLGPDSGRAALGRRPRVSALWVLAEPDGAVRLVPSGAPD